MTRIGLFCLALLTTFYSSIAQEKGAVLHAKKNAPAGMALIPGGAFVPYLKENGKSILVQVDSFYLDKHAVTNKQYLKFVKANPEWSRSNIPALLADKFYLKNWKSDYKIGDSCLFNSPVTYISWHAAKAYAEWAGKRLPTMQEWEYAAYGDPVNLPENQSLTQLILDWYGTPLDGNLPPVKSVYENEYGLYDMFGLIWEWPADFNSVMMNSNGAANRNLYCATNSLQTANKREYASFMRFAFRAGLSSKYTLKNLGFRCASDLKQLNNSSI